MTYSEMYQWMTEPSLLSKSSLPDLKQTVDEYPCFHAVRMLYLKNLAVLEDVRLEKELKKMAVFLPDRKQLFMLIEEKRFQMKRPKETSPVGALSDPAGAPSDYIHYLATHTEDLPTEDGDDRQLKRQDLIDSFIAGDKQRVQRLPLLPETENTPEPEADDLPEEAKNTFENTAIDDSYFTETLARVYFSQKRYDKALEIIRVLSLKYPKKSAYFADQIRYIEKIINEK